MKKIFPLILIALLCVLSCGGRKNILSLTGGRIAVVETDERASLPALVAVVEQGSQAVDSIRRPVLGEAAVPLMKGVPESTLMNFAADAILSMARECTGENVEIAITNKGGLRSEIDAGVITFGDVYNVFTFENKLALLTLSGENLLQLCREIAAVGGEAISGLSLVIRPDGTLVTVLAGGEPIELSRNYLVATSDYLSQGNDRMTALALASECRVFDDITIRDLVVRYICAAAAAGEKVSAECDGRITIQE